MYGHERTLMIHIHTSAVASSKATASANAGPGKPRKETQQENWPQQWRENITVSFVQACHWLNRTKEK